MEWRGSEAHARPDADPLRGALSGRHRPSLGQGRRRPRSIVFIRHRDGDDRPKIPQLHAQLSEFDPALRETGDWNLDTRSLAHYLGHRNLQSTARYTALAPDRFKGFWKD